MTTFFIDHNEKIQFDTAIRSYIHSRGINFRSEVKPQSSLKYAKVDENLIIKQVSNLKNSITLDKSMVSAYWGKQWLLERFVEYLKKRNGMLQYSEYILDILAKYDKGIVTKEDFVKMFETSSLPNRIFTSQEMWHYYLKTNLRY